MEEYGTEIRQTLRLADLTVMETCSPKYHDRTVANAGWADLTVAFAADFSTAGEKLTRRAAGDRYMAVDIPRERELLQNGSIHDRIADIICHSTESMNGIRLNVAGNSLETLQSYGIAQEDVDAFVAGVLGKAMAKGMPVVEIRTGGQSGVDEAGTKAAIGYGIRASQMVPRGFLYNDARGLPHWNRKSFLSRFEGIRRRPLPVILFNVDDALRKAMGSGRGQIDNYCSFTRSALPGIIAGDILGAPYRETDALVSSFEFFRPARARDGRGEVVNHHCRPTANTFLALSVCGWLLHGDHTDGRDLRRRLPRELPEGSAGIAAALTVIGLYTDHLLEARDLARTAASAFRLTDREKGLCEASVMACFMLSHGRDRNEVRFSMEEDYGLPLTLPMAGIHAAEMMREGKPDRDIASVILQDHGLQLVKVPAERRSPDDPRMCTLEEILPRTMQMKTETVLVNGEPFSYETATGRRSHDVADVLPAALACFMTSFSFDEALRRAILLGGDSPAMAALTGAFCGPYYGGIPRDIAERCMITMEGRDVQALTEFIGGCGEHQEMPELRQVTREQRQEARVMFEQLSDFCESLRTDLERAAGYTGDGHVRFETACYPERQGDTICVYDHSVVDGMVGIDPVTGLLRVDVGPGYRDGEYGDADWCREHVFDKGRVITFSLSYGGLPEGWEKTLRREGITLDAEERASLQRMQTGASVYTRDLDGLKASISRACLDQGIGIGDEDRKTNLEKAHEDMLGMSGQEESRRQGRGGLRP